MLGGIIRQFAASATKMNLGGLLQNNPFQRLGLSLDLQIRGAKFGTEYQPSVVRRKRKHGFLVRMASADGRKVILRRLLKGRKFLSR